MTATDVVCLGESMVTFLPSRPGRLADVPSFVRAIGGAESNVACALAAAGHRTRWVSRVGADGFGDHLVQAVAAYGVDTAAVRRDPTRPTGIYFRTATDRTTDAHEVVYYRAGSAASAMSPETVSYEDLAPARVLHLSGITAALSAGCLALMRALTARRPGRPLLSFDVNHRPGLWRGADPSVLLDLARGADLVFVGEDEAEAAWSLRGAAAIRAALPEPCVVVVKQGGRGATAFSRCAGVEPGAPPPDPRASNAGEAECAPRREAAAHQGCGGVSPHGETSPPAQGAWGRSPQFREGAGWGTAPRSGPTPAPAHPVPSPGAAPDPGRRPDGQGARPQQGPQQGDTVTFVPAPRVDVVAPVGAGDAFAAGFIGATLRGLGLTHRLRHGHLMAAAALTVPGDLGTPPATAHADRLAGLDEDAWERLHLGPGWTRTGEDQEVRTP
ncbi:PfkB family carbohydrate kinase [Streptomyces sp. CB03238]|uniref:sugar kinase n=1 Tax=Streptomyces sp. CB03238 TaxID=1907777 RepID=UPI00240A32FF|nr:PfkB family carbohydrate kinase [Streptomyces sp. CB03238]